MAICSEVLKQQGLPCPRTCAVHGLAGCKISEDQSKRVVRVDVVLGTAVLRLPDDMDAVLLKRHHIEQLISDLQHALEQME